MRILKATLAVTLAAVIVTLLGCAKSSGATQAQTATVQRGNVSVTTTTAGNLAFIRTENDAFKVYGKGDVVGSAQGTWTVTAVNVQVGDYVTAGEVLASLNTTTFQDDITALEQTLLSDQEAVTQAQINLTNAQIALDKMTGSVPSTSVETAQAGVDTAMTNLQYALNSATSASANGGPSWQSVIAVAESKLKSAENGLNALLTTATADQVTAAEMQVDLAAGQLQSAENAVLDAQHALDEANTGSPYVTCSFDGVVTAVDVTQGQVINSGAVAATIADPTQYEVQVPVGEQGALSLQVGGTATVSINALSGVTLPGTITAVAPTATIQSGVVNYQVTVEVTSFVPISGGLGSGQRSFYGGGTTSGNQGGTFQGGGRQFAGGTATPTPSQPVKVMQGLSVTVNLVTAQATNVLMVPNRAVVRQKGKTYVNVLKNGTTAQVAVTTGISNTQFTQVITGLNEGDTVVLSAATAATPTPTPRPGGGLRIPGF